MAQRNYRPTGNWVTGDSSTNHLQVCETDDNTIVALASTFDPESILYVPRAQLNNFIAAAASGQMSRIGLHA